MVSKKASARILLIDGMDNSRMLTSLLLDEWGYSFESARNWEDAIRKYKGGAFAAILADAEHMPEIYDSISTIREYEKAEQRKPACIIAITPGALLGGKKRLPEKGIDDYISKPINYDSLQEKLRECVG